MKLRYVMSNDRKNQTVHVLAFEEGQEDFELHVPKKVCSIPYGNPDKHRYSISSDAEEAGNALVVICKHFYDFSEAMMTAVKGKNHGY